MYQLSCRLRVQIIPQLYERGIYLEDKTRISVQGAAARGYTALNIEAERKEQNEEIVLLKRVERVLL
jgi:hypothetical protein